MKKIILILLAVILILPLSSCTLSDRITEDSYFADIYADHITYLGNYYEEMVTPANAVGEGWPAPGAANCQSGYVYLFADQALAVNETFLHFTMQMPHSWKEGTNIIPEIRFIYNSDEVGTNVRWKIAYSWANIGDNFPVSTNIWAVSDATNNDSLKHQITKFAPISGVGQKVGSILMCYLSRNSSDVLDTYTDTVRFISVGVLYQVDSPASMNQWTK